MIDRTGCRFADSGNSALQSSLRSRICGVSIDGRVLLQAFAQLGHAGRFERETDGVRVAAEADEDVVAAFERFEQMEAGDGAAGAVCFAVLVAEHERRAPGALDHARGEDAEHAAMPAFAVDDQAAEPVDCAVGEHRVNLRKNRRLGGTAIGVELIELLRERAGALRIARGE